jgi:hypothetical protein
MRALSTFLHATSDTATALLNVASIAIATGAVAAACTARLRIGLIVGACALIIAAAGFGFNLWRTYGPSTRRRVFWFRLRSFSFRRLMVSRVGYDNGTVQET